MKVCKAFLSGRKLAHIQALRRSEYESGCILNSGKKRAYFRVGLLLSEIFSYLKFGGPTILWAYLWWAYLRAFTVFYGRIFSVLILIL